MIKRVKERGYKFKHAFGDIVVDEVVIGVSEAGRRSISADEIERLARLVATKFVKENYRKAIADPDFSMSAAVVRAIMVFLRVNQEEFGRLVGCQKSKVSKILRNEQPISKSQALLALERLCLEVVRPGAVRGLLGDEESVVSDPDEAIAHDINEARYGKSA